MKTLSFKKLTREEFLKRYPEAFEEFDSLEDIGVVVSDETMFGEVKKPSMSFCACVLNAWGEPYVWHDADDGWLEIKGASFVEI